MLQEWHLHPPLFAAIALSGQTLLASPQLCKRACTYKSEQVHTNAHIAIQTTVLQYHTVFFYVRSKGNRFCLNLLFCCHNLIPVIRINTFVAF